MDIDRFSKRVKLDVGNVNRSFEISPYQEKLYSALIRMNDLMRNVNRMSSAFPDV